MAASNYAPGTWLGIVRSRTVVLLGSDAPPALVHSLWDLLENGPEVHEVLHAVTSSFGLSLAQIPWFGIVDFRDSLRVFLRGDLDLTVQLAGGPVDLNGRDVTTWTERRFAAPEWYRVTAPGGGPAGQELPLGEGVVLLQSLTVSLAGTPAAGAPEPAVALANVTQAAVPARAVPETAETETAVPETAVPGVASETVIEPEPVVEPVPEVEPVPAVESEPVLEAASAGAEHGASADTVIGVHDGDPDSAAEIPESRQDEEPASRPDQRPDHVSDQGPDQVPAHELTGTYDHLWERTVVRSIEDAAVRDDPDTEDSDAPALAPAEEDGADGHAALEAPAAAAPQTGSVLPDPPVPEPATALAAPAGGLIDGGLNAGGLIDSVPWRTGGDSARSPQAPPSFNIPAGAVPAGGAGPGPGSQPPSVTRELPGADPLGFDGDHDGHTVMKSDLAGMTAHPAPAVTPDPDAAGPLVLARVCGKDHANPPTHSICAACGLPLPSDAVQAARPRLGRMRVSTGELVDLDQSLVIGRQPSVSRVQGGVMPRLVQVASPSGDISRSHVEVRLEGWHVMLCDLKATNGTVLVREGQQPRRLAQNEMAILLDGDIAELGDDISLRFEEIL